MPDTPAHSASETIHLKRWYPDHAPRQEDPNYHLFEQTKARLKAQGLWKCVIATEDCAGPCSLHHSHFEFAYANEVDVDKANELLGLHLSDDEFAKWIEQEGNLEVLCFQHHMGDFAIHRIPAADWDIVRTHKTGETPIQVVKVPGKEDQSADSHDDQRRSREESAG
jgi:hypothetical protein